MHRQLGHKRALIVGAPDYWAARGIPETPHELDRHTCVLMRSPGGILIDLWEFERGAQKAAVKVTGWFSSSGREIVLDRVLAGEGIARLNHLTTRTYLQTGRLVPALLEWEVQGGPPINVLFRPSQRRTPRVRLFVDFVSTLLREIEAEVGRSAARPHWHRAGYGRASSVLRPRSGAS